MRVKLRGAARIAIAGEHIRLDSLLKFANVASTGGEAKHMIQSGMVAVGGEVCRQRGRKIRPGDIVRCAGGILLVKSEP